MRDGPIHDKANRVKKAHWVGALLHDVGKLVIGFFSWECGARAESPEAEKVQLQAGGGEAELGDVAGSLANDLGLGCMPGEEGGFDPRVLAKLGVSEPQLEELTRWPREW